MTCPLNPLCAATWFLQKYRARQAEAGTEAVARQLRKQGVPLPVALAILAPGARPR